MDHALPPHWEVRDNALVRTIQRADFIEALGFTLAAAKLAEAADHHPDIDLRYNRVQFSLTTHSAGHQITARDFSLAEEINRLSEHDIQIMTQDLRTLLKT